MVQTGCQEELMASRFFVALSMRSIVSAKRFILVGLCNNLGGRFRVCTALVA